jgi:hypothetical protein
MASPPLGSYASPRALPPVDDYRNPHRAKRSKGSGGGWYDVVLAPVAAAATATVGVATSRGRAAFRARPLETAAVVLAGIGW